LSFRGTRTLTAPSFDPDTLLRNPSRRPAGKEERERLLQEELRKSDRLVFPDGLVRWGEDRVGKGLDFLVESASGCTVTIEFTELPPYWPHAPSAGSPSRSSAPTTTPPNPDRWAMVSDSEQRRTVMPPTLTKRPGAPRKA
jgi:hypothetical protein